MIPSDRVALYVLYLSNQGFALHWLRYKSALFRYAVDSLLTPPFYRSFTST